MDLKISEMVNSEMQLSPEESLLVDELIPIERFDKGTLLLEEGQIARDCYFIIEGCVRSYQIKEGEERTVGFYVEGESIAPLASYLGQKPADHFLICLEDSVLAVLNYDKEKELYCKLPKMEALCRVSIEEEFGKQQAFLSKFVTRSPEERYIDLLDTQPELVQRVLQYQLASYLGIQPESLSRIRKRLAEKERRGGK